MSKPGKELECVAIAKDALKQIAIKKYVPRHQVYVLEEGTYNFILNHYKGELQPYIKKLKKPCAVCAIGALFLSTVRKYNAFKSNGKVLSYDMQRKLGQFFRPEEVCRIECYFEDGQLFNMKKDAPHLKAILNNIVKNNGSFTLDTGEGGD